MFSAKNIVLLTEINGFFDASLLHNYMDVIFNYWGTVVKVNGKKSTIENDNGLVSIKGTGKRTIVEVSSTYPTTMILSLLISSITFIFLFTRYLIRCCGEMKID